MGPYVYTDMNCYPTRDGTNLVLATWNDFLFAHPVNIYNIYLYTTFSPASAIKFNDKWRISDDNPFSDSMSYISKTDITAYLRDGELYRTWVAAGLTVVFFLVYETYADGNYGTFRARQCSYGDNFITSSAPSISFSGGAFNIGSCCAGRRIIEFRRTDIPYGGNTGISDEDTLNEMLYTSLINMERSNPYQGYYYLSNNPRLNRWSPGRYTVGVTFVSSKNQSVISNAINHAITEINAVMSEFGVSFVRSGTSGDISITVDSESALYPDRPSGYVYGGTWETTKSNGIITSARIKYANDFQDYAAYQDFDVVVFEELLQCMGAGFDQVMYPYDTIHTDMNYYNKRSSMYQRDANILRLVYSSEVSPNDTYAEVARKLNIPRGCYLVDTSTSDTARTVQASSFLSPGGRYEVRAFIVNSSGRVSATSNWITIDVPAIQRWDWTKSNGSATTSATITAYNSLYSGGRVSNFSYTVWNDMCDKTMEVLQYTGKTWSTYYGLTLAQTKMSASNKTLTAARFNSLRYNISRIYPPPGITMVSKGDIVYASYFTTLTDSINIGIDNL